MSQLHLLVGLPGIGKTTYARRFLSHTVRVSNDELYRMISGKWQSDRRPIYHYAENAIISFALEHGFDVLVDRTNMTREGRKRFIDLGNQHHATIVAVVFPLDLDNAMNRNVYPERVEAGVVVPDSVIRAMHDEYQEPHLSEGFDHIISVVDMPREMWD